MDLTVKCGVDESQRLNATLSHNMSPVHRRIQYTFCINFWPTLLVCNREQGECETTFLSDA
jgi:hypothetical protein